MKKLIVLFVVCLSVWGAQAQQWKIGYVDIAIALELHPQVKQNRMAQQLRTKSATEKIQLMQQGAQAKFEEYQQKQKEGAPLAILETLKAEIQLMEGDIQQFAAEEEKGIQEKAAKDNLAVMEQLDTAVNQLFREYKLDCLFQMADQNGVSTMLFAPESINLQKVFLEKLGITIPADYAATLPTAYACPENMKVAYSNAELILSMMPEVQQLEGMVGAEQKKMQQSIEIKQNYAMLKMQEYESARATEKPEQLKVREEELMKLDQELQDFAQDSEQKLFQFRTAKLEEVLSKVQGAVDAIAEEKGLDMVFNQSNGAGVSTILFGPEKADITRLVAQKLGLKLPDGEVVEFEASPAKKMGYANVEQIMAQMPEIKGINQEISSVEQMYTAQLTAKQKVVQDMYANLQQSYQGMDATQRAQAEKSVTDAQNELQQLATQADAAVQNTQMELLQPIQTKLQKAIDEEAAAKGYDFIFNQTAALNILQMKDADHISEDLLGRVKGQ